MSTIAEQSRAARERRSPHATRDGDRHTCWSGQIEQELQLMARVLDGLRRL